MFITTIDRNSTIYVTVNPESKANPFYISCLVKTPEAPKMAERPKIPTKMRLLTANRMKKKTVTQKHFQ